MRKGQNKTGVILQVLLVVLLLTLPGRTPAAAWVEPGNLRIRHALQEQVDRGCGTALVDTWPVSAAQITSTLSPDDGCSYSAAAFLLRDQLAATPGGKFAGSLHVAGATDEPLFRGFAARPRERGELGASLAGEGEYLAGRLQVTSVDAGRGQNTLRIDGSYVAARLGNWVLGAGAIDRWWGPGWYSSLALSSNARPVPSLWLTRDGAEPFDLPVLHYLGPWNITLLAGQLESMRAIPNAKLLGVRFSFRPWRYLEVGINRLAQWGGTGRPESASSLWELAIGRDNGANHNPGNQLGGMDFRLGIPLRTSTLGLYGQYMGEDEAHHHPSKDSFLLGVDWATAFGNSSQRWVLEATNTISGGWFSQHRHYLTTYEHSTYTSGFRYHGRALASSWEGDAEVVTAGMFQFYHYWTLWLNVSHAILDASGRLRPSALTPAPPALAMTTRQNLAILRIGADFPLLVGTVNVSAHYLSEPLQTITGPTDRVGLALSWNYDFNL